MRVVAIVGIVLLAGGLSQAGEKGAAAGSGNALQVLTQSKLEVGDVPGHELAKAVREYAEKLASKPFRPLAEMKARINAIARTGIPEVNAMTEGFLDRA